MKRCRRSFISDSSLADTSYHRKKRVGPPVLTFPENVACEFLLDDSKSVIFWSLMRYKTTGWRIPCWTGFQILIDNNIPILKTTVG